MKYVTRAVWIVTDPTTERLTAGHGCRTDPGTGTTAPEAGAAKRAKEKDEESVIAAQPARPGRPAGGDKTPDDRPGRWVKLWVNVSIEGWGRDSVKAPYTAVRWIDDWQADHRVPLWSVDRAAPDAFRFWTVDNLQTLCGPCHKAKTAGEATERSRRRSRQGSLALGVAA